MADAGIDAKAAIERVLRAEGQAQAELEQAQAQAQAELERARDDALAIVNRAAQRIARWQRIHAQALERRLAALRAEAEMAARHDAPPDAAVLADAVRRVAEQLTGGIDGARG